jgi:hypothetical protein
MKNYKLVLSKINKLDSVTCDVCGKKYSWDISLGQKEFLEAQEFVHIEKLCGYNTIFEDGQKIEVDICQHCFKKHIMDKIGEKKWHTSSQRKKKGLSRSTAVFARKSSMKK